MSTKVKQFIKIPRNEYRDLVEKKAKYEQLASWVAEDIFASPPTRDSRQVIAEFKKTGQYNKSFLSSLEQGLKKSSYFKK